MTGDREMKFQAILLIIAAILMGAVVLVLAATGKAEETIEPITQPQEALLPAAPTAAVLTFQSNLKKPENSGQLIADILSARIGVLGELSIVERQDIEKILEEQKLTLAGLVSPDKDVEVGKLLGAKLLITGRVTTAGQRIYLVCKVINAETSQVKGFILSLEQNITFDDLLDKAGTKLIDSLPTWTSKLIPEEKRPPDDVAVLKNLMKNKDFPQLAVIIPEQHIGPAVMDPAVETEFKKLLTEAGLQPLKLTEETIKSVSSNLNDYSNLRYLLADTRYLICGEAFSERSGQLHGLTICSARAEAQIVDLQTGKILFSDRQTARAPDLSEHLAGKTALQKAGRKLAMKLLPKLIEHFPSAAEEKTDETKAE